MIRIACILAVLCAMAPLTSARIREGDCEVCLKVVNKFIDNAKAAKAKSPAKIEKVIMKTCKGLQDTKENRFCYFIGGTSDAATRTLSSVSKPISHFLPATKICEKLKKRDTEICDLKYEKPIDLEGKNIGKMRVKELKKVLKSWGEKCKGCTSKRDYVDMVKRLKDKYAAPKDEL